MSDIYIAAGLQVGEPVLFEKMFELPAFEDKLAGIIDPNMTDEQYELWSDRTHLEKLLRPKQFIGDIVGIQLEPIAEPYTHLIETMKRAARFPEGGPMPRRTKSTVDQAHRFAGFVFKAQSKSSSVANNGEITSQLWYYPAPTFADNRREKASVNRRVNKPVWQKGKALGAQPAPTVNTRVRMQTVSKISQTRFLSAERY